MKWSLVFISFLVLNIIPTQQVTYQEKEKYLKKLIEIQQNMHNQIEDLRQVNKNTIFNSESLKSHPDLQKSVLEQGIKLQRQKIQNTFKQTLIPLKDNYWTCKNLSPSQKQLIAKKIKDLKDKSGEISKITQSQNDCTRNVQLKSNLKFLKLHIQSLQNQLSNTCEPLRKDDLKINNLETGNNWIYGSTSPKDYDNKLRDLENKYNLVKCQKQKPFLINTQCSACSKTQQIFSISQQKCIQKCPDNTIFLKINHECRDPNKKQVISPNIQNLDGSKYPFIWGPITEQQYKDQIKQLKDNKVPVEQCSPEKPFPGKDACISCPQGKLFNVGQKQCSSCLNGQKYKDNTHQCKQVYKKPNYDVGKNWIAVNGDNKPIDNKLKDLQNQNYPVQTCPSDKPFPSKDLKSCVSCDKYYDLSKGTCQQCQKYFNIKDGGHQCVYEVKKCQKDQYWNGQKCVQCLKPGFYDNNLRTCVCPSNQKYDQPSGTCFASNLEQKNSNPIKATNFVGPLPSPSKFLQNCPQNKPFYQLSSKSCVQCALPTKYFNFEKNKCQECSKNTQFNVDTKQCVQSVALMNSNIGPSADNYCCGQPVVYKGKQSCPLDRPFFDGYHCISCSKPQYFDFKEKYCKKCPNGKAFSSTKKQCVDESWLESKIISNIPNDKKNYNGPIPVIKPDIEGQQIIKCPTQKPFSNGKQCFSCDLPRYFNFQSNQCQICKEGYSFSTDDRQCRRNTIVGKDVYNSNMITAQNFIGKVPEYKSQYPQCQQSKRYFNGGQCQRCQLPQYWDFDRNQCKDCSKGLYFDKNARQCIYDSGSQSYKTNIDASKNIYYNGDFDDIKKEVSQSKGTLCPKDSPFYDKSSNSCINCSGDAYIFNFNKNHCMRCPGNTYFNDEYHICFQNGVQPTVERMVMNSWSWI